MPKLTYFPLIMDRWIAGTRHMSLEEKGAYLELLIYLYEKRGRYLKDERHIARILGCRPEKARRIWLGICDKFRCVAIGKPGGKVAHNSELSTHIAQGYVHSLVIDLQRNGMKVRGLQSEGLHTDPDPDPEEEKKEEEPLSVSSPRSDLRFAEWWAAYPKKTGKKPCLAIWKRRKLDSQADRLVNDTSARATTDVQWLDGFIPNPQTYLNQDRWEDEIQTNRSNGNGKQQRPMTKDDYVAKQQERMDARADGEILEGDGQPVWPALVR